jgi:hypothetical protein
VPARISRIPNTSSQTGCVENEKSPNPTVATVSTVKYAALITLSSCPRRRVWYPKCNSSVENTSSVKPQPIASRSERSLSLCS